MSETGHDELQQMSRADITSHSGAASVRNKYYLMIDLHFAVHGC